MTRPISLIDKNELKIIVVCILCRACSAFGEKVTDSQSFYCSELVTNFSAPKEEFQLVSTGPIFGLNGKKLFIIDTLDSFQKRPSAFKTRKSGCEKIVIFLKGYISQHSIPRNLRKDRY